MKRMQYLRDFTPCNRTQFGKRIAKAAYAMLHDFNKEYPFGFQDGGCLMFALALRKWSHGHLKLASIMDYGCHDIRASHVVTYFKHKDITVIIDSEGMGYPSDILAKVQAMYWDSPGIKYICTKPMQEGILNEASSVSHLVSDLTKYMGAFNLLALQKELDT